MWQKFKAISYANSKPRKVTLLLLTILTATTILSMTAKATVVVTIMKLV